MRNNSKGLNSFTVNYLGKDAPQTLEVFASTLKQALIQANEQLQKQFGWEFIIITIRQN